jgi:hypothetical protein
MGCPLEPMTAVSPGLTPDLNVLVLRHRLAHDLPACIDKAQNTVGHADFVIMPLRDSSSGRWADQGRLYVISADGGDCISDAVLETRKSSRRQCRCVAKSSINPRAL